MTAEGAGAAGDEAFGACGITAGLGVLRVSLRLMALPCKNLYSLLSPMTTLLWEPLLANDVELESLFNVVFDGTGDIPLEALESFFAGVFDDTGDVLWGTCSLAVEGGAEVAGDVCWTAEAAVADGCL
mmetsp:Transcript_128764/g.240798  ORF Transcript_128764/g.240798 Transcript_128764/m.240798 type:complete len:128 (-) Transcript_128764:34-417(-)